MKYPRTNPEARQDLKDSMMEQAINNIEDDADRIEKIIEENSDLIQDLRFKYKESYKNMSRFIVGEARVRQDSLLLADFGLAIYELIDSKILLLAEEDVEEAME